MKCRVYKRSVFILLGAGALALTTALGPAHATSRPANQTRHLDMIYVTLARVTTEARLGSNAPHARNVFRTVWLRTVNRNDVQVQLTMTDVALVTPDGRALNVAYSTPAPALTNSVLDVGGRAAGSITFEVPESVHRATLRWAATPPRGLRWPTVSWPIVF
jgi:hypothetical protein